MRSAKARLAAVKAMSIEEQGATLAAMPPDMKEAIFKSCCVDEKKALQAAHHVCRCGDIEIMLNGKPHMVIEHHLAQPTIHEIWMLYRHLNTHIRCAGHCGRNTSAVKMCCKARTADGATTNSAIVVLLKTSRNYGSRLQKRTLRSVTNISWSSLQITTKM